MRKPRLVRSCAAAALWLWAAAAHGQNPTPQEAQDPLTRLRGLTFQNNIDFGIGEDDRTGYQLLLQPWQADLGKGEWWRLRSIAGFPLAYRPDAFGGGTLGLGDAEVSAFWTPTASSGASVGIGPILRFPVATDPALGSGKWSAGATVAVVARPRNWLVGFRSFNLWSFAGSRQRPDVNQFFLQYIALRSFARGWYVVSAPKILANWDAPSGDRWLVPIGGGAGKLFRIGRRGVDVQAQGFYNVVRPQTLPSARWTLRAQVQFLFAS